MARVGLRITLAKTLVTGKLMGVQSATRSLTVHDGRIASTRENSPSVYLLLPSEMAPFAILFARHYSDTWHPWASPGGAHVRPEY